MLKRGSIAIFAIVLWAVESTASADPDIIPKWTGVGIVVTVAVFLLGIVWSLIHLTDRKLRHSAPPAEPENLQQHPSTFSSPPDNHVPPKKTDTAAGCATAILLLAFFVFLAIALLVLWISSGTTLDILWIVVPLCAAFVTLFAAIKLGK